MIVGTATAEEFVAGVSTIYIPKPSEETIEKFRRIIGVADDWDKDNYLIDKSHCYALITEEMSLDDLKKVFLHDDRFYAGFWRFDGRWLRRKRHDDVNIGIKAGDKVCMYKAEGLANVLKVAGKEVHLYVCDRKGSSDTEWALLLVLNDNCGIVLAPVVVKDEYEDITRVARQIYAGFRLTERGSDGFLDQLSEEEALELIERLQKELGILHM